MLPVNYSSTTKQINKIELYTSNFYYSVRIFKPQNKFSIFCINMTIICLIVIL